MGDFVKGRQYESYPKIIQSGILLHREIDSFTDSHPIFMETVSLLRPAFARYSGIMADMFFDYCLASNFDKYSPHQSLDSFSRGFNATCIINYKLLPENIKSFIFHFISTNRLQRYASMEGLEESLRIMSVKKSSAIKPELSISFLKENEGEIRALFDEFMPEVIRFSDKNIEELIESGNL